MTTPTTKSNGSAANGPAGVAASMLVVEWLAEHVPKVLGKLKLAVRDEIKEELEQHSRDNLVALIDKAVGSATRTVTGAEIVDDELLLTFEQNGVVDRKFVGTVVGRHGRGISNADIIANELVITYDDGSFVNLGNVSGKNGDTIENMQLLDGTLTVQLLTHAGTLVEYKFEGLAGKDGANGVDGKNGKAGKQGPKGDAGRAVQEAYITNQGKLVLEFDDGTTADLGWVGTGNVANAEINRRGELLVTLTDNREIRCGKVVGVDGINGADGVDGTDGPGFIWRGQYRSQTTYYGQGDNPDGPWADVVQFEGSSYTCTGETRQPPPGGAWDLMAAKGKGPEAQPQVIYLGGGGGGGAGGGGDASPAEFLPINPGATAAVGTSLRYAREDHRHQQQDLTSYSKVDGSRDFTGQITVPDATGPGKAVNKGQMDFAISSAVAGIDPPDPATLAGSSPTVSGTVGTSLNYARQDHSHPKQPAVEYVTADAVPVFTVRRLTETQYAALSPPDPNTLYAIIAG